MHTFLISLGGTFLDKLGSLCLLMSDWCVAFLFFQPSTFSYFSHPRTKPDFFLSESSCGKCPLQF